MDTQVCHEVFTLMIHEKQNDLGKDSQRGDIEWERLIKQCKRIRIDEILKQNEMKNLKLEAEVQD